MPASSKSNALYRRPLYPKMLFPDLTSYSFPLSPDLHSGVINNKLIVPSYKRLRPGIVRVRSGRAAMIFRYPRFLRQLALRLVGPRGRLSSYAAR
ncbi:MAG TPA: hypothetical protein VE196_03385, partial [Pseudonocardiaceae bacterium]|nr:hypothetical protein [Pseudonocardiaceae bacterium]